MKGDTVTKQEQKIIRNIQKDTLFWIVRGLRTKSLTQDYVKALAGQTLEATRKQTIEECFEALYQATEKFWEANDVYVKNAKVYYILVDQGRLERGRVKLEEKDIEGAIFALKGGEN